MRKLALSSLIAWGVVGVAACSDSPPVDSTPGAGTAGAPATSGAGGASAAGSSSVGGGGSPGASGSATAGSTMAGSGGALAGSGGAAGSAGAGGSAGSGGGGAYVPKPSAGCGKTNPATGARTITTGGKTGEFNVHLPDDYQASTPVPLGFGFHGFGNGACGPDQGECRGFKELPAVTVYMKSLDEGWEQQQILEQNVTFWQDVLAQMKNEYCIDENKIFIAGVSSGGQFIEHLTCRFGDTLWQVTPVSASVVGSAQNDCKGTPPILVIHGVTDQAGEYGVAVAEMFAERNGCSDQHPAGLQQAQDDLMAAREAERAEHICLDWDACTKNPVRFCLSSQITYSGLTHGWPMIGGELIGDFQATLE